MKNLLITGFEPFGGEGINPSWEAVTLLPEEIGEYQLIKMCLPVVFKEAAKMAIDKAEKVKPDVIICVGQAGGRNAITPEFIGINFRHASIPDNRGNKPQDEHIDEGGENAHFSTLPVREIAEGIKASGIPSQVSYSAGTYVCNELLYVLLAHYKNSGVRVGFIHIPYCEEQNKTPSMAISDVVKGLKIAIENL